MKKIIPLLFLFLGNACLFSQTGYWYKSEYIALNPEKSMYFIQTSEKEATTRRSELLNYQRRKEITSFDRIADNRFLIVSEQPKIDTEDYFSHVYYNPQYGRTIILPRIILTLKEGQMIKLVLAKHSDILAIEETNGVKYILRCQVSKSEDVLQVVESIQKMEQQVEWCEPEMLSDIRMNNPLYPQQYYLRNTGQNGGTPGIDINIEPAWNITSGSSDITIAVVDCGVDRNHEDMGTRVLEGYTIRNPAGFGIPQNVNALNPKAHGMACAGIIAAADNDRGIRGIANNAMILSVNIVPDFAVTDPFTGQILEGFGSNIEIAQALNWTWKRADILSCSWGGGNPSNDITLAIDSARNFGRNGKGSIVVFASGNNHPYVSDVSFPGNVDGVITVGAINNQGTIWNYSQRGPSMDLVAPSGGIPGDIVTTDRMGDLGYVAGNYFTQFNGTSGACPQVAGVAALMLSVNPNLTESQVRTALQNTARDLGSTGFDNTYGYGLVNASAAVNAVTPQISGPSLICNQATYTINPPSGATVTWSASNNNLQLISGQGTNEAVFKKNGNGASSILCTLTIGSQSVSIPPLNIHVGLPDSPIIVGESELICNNLALYTVHNVSNVTWSVQGPLRIVGPNAGYRCTVEGRSNGVGWVYATTSNNCGTVRGEILVTVTCSALSLYPNPADDMVTVELQEEQPADTSLSTQRTTKTFSTGIYEIQLWSSSAMLKRFTTDQPVSQIPVSGLPAGIYFVRVIKNGQTYTKKLIKR